MSIRDELSRVHEYLSDPSKRPTNEANTCNWVIYPLLLRCGYDFHEIHVQALDTAGKFPDYTVLPNTPHTWLLEAKAWHVSLGVDEHVTQAMNYAHTRGHRWFVLSNGREWRLYDDHINGVQPAERLVATAKLECQDDLEEMLDALSKASVQTGGVAAYAVQARVNSVLNQQLQLTNSDIIKSVTTTLKNKLGLNSINATDVVAYFNKRHFTRFGTVSAPEPTVELMQPPSPNPHHEGATQIGGLPLPGLAAMGLAIQSRKPTIITFPDRTAKDLSSWRDATIELISWLFSNGKRPALPFRGRNGGKLHLISTTPIHSTGKVGRHKEININGETLYVDVNRSAADFVSCLNVLCAEVGIDASEFLISLRR